jgi:nucleoside-diphosphate-sugar epimerase
MPVFVTGGSGFVGGALIEELRDRGEIVRALARTPGAEKRVSDHGAVPVPGDLADGTALVDGMRGAELVVHAAAKITGGLRDLDEFYRVNVEGTRAVLDAARLAGVPRLVYVSSEQVLLGQRPLVDADETWPYPARHANPYAATKAEAERLLLDANTAELATVAIRPRMVWGLGDQTMLPTLVTVARSRRFRWIDGGRHLTSTTHVRNVVEGILAAAERGRGGQAYFVTDGQPTIFREFAAELLATQGVPEPTGEIPRWLAMAAANATSAAWRFLPLPGEPLFDPLTVRVVGEICTVLDGKARRELGYEGRVSRAEGLAELRSQESPADA